MHAIRLMKFDGKERREGEAVFEKREGEDRVFVFLEREGKEICFVVRESGWRNERNEGFDLYIGEHSSNYQMTKIPLLGAK